MFLRILLGFLVVIFFTMPAMSKEKITGNFLFTTLSPPSLHGVAISENQGIAVKCDEGNKELFLSSITTSGSVTSAVSNLGTNCTIESPSAFFTGGVESKTVGGSTTIGSPTVQSNARGILITENPLYQFLDVSGQLTGSTNGFVVEVSLPNGCDVIDDLDDPDTAPTSTLNIGGNEITRPIILKTAGITKASFEGGSGNVIVTLSNSISPASDSTPAKIKFYLQPEAGDTDRSITDSVLLLFDAQDIFCPSTISGDLTSMVTLQNKISDPSLIVPLGSVNLGSATEAFSVGFGSSASTSLKGVLNSNSNQGGTAIINNGNTCTSSPIEIVELSETSIPIGGRVSEKNLNLLNATSGTVINEGELWLIPTKISFFNDAPDEEDIIFSDDSLTTNGAPKIVTSSSISNQAPIGTLIIPIKKNLNSTLDPSTTKTTITINNLNFLNPQDSLGVNLAVEFFIPSAKVVVNTGGVVSANNFYVPTVFTPYGIGSQTAINQLNSEALQLGTATITNLLLFNRLSELNTPILNPLTISYDLIQEPDASKISLSSTSTDDNNEQAVTFIGEKGSVQPGSDVILSSSGYDSVTVRADKDGGFTAKLKINCSSSPSNKVILIPSICGVSGSSIKKTVLCGRGDPFQPPELEELENATVQEIIDYINAKGGLAAIVNGDIVILANIIVALKNALGII